MIYSDTGSSNKTEYLHRDHLGSIEVVTSGSGQVLQLSGDAIWRAAQIVALAKIAGVDGRYVRERIKPYELYIRRDQHGAAIDPNLVVDHFWACL